MRRLCFAMTLFSATTLLALTLPASAGVAKAP